MNKVYKMHHGGANPVKIHVCVPFQVVELRHKLQFKVIGVVSDAIFKLRLARIWVTLSVPLCRQDTYFFLPPPSATFMPVCGY